MRTVIFVIAGFGFLVLSLAIARAIKPSMARATTLGVPMFIALWCLVAATNMWIGVNNAGYSVREELPIFLIIFLPPVLAALLAKWHWR